MSAGYLYGAFDETGFFVSGEFAGGGIVDPVTDPKVGGDSVVGRRRGGGHPGWNAKRAKLKLDREREFTEQIRTIYRELSAAPEVAQQAAQIVREALPAPSIAHEPSRLLDVLRERASAANAQAVQAELELRFLHRYLQDLMDQEDEHAILHVMQNIL